METYQMLEDTQQLSPHVNFRIGDRTYFHGSVWSDQQFNLDSVQVYQVDLDTRYCDVNTETNPEQLGDACTRSDESGGQLRSLTTRLWQCDAGYTIADWDSCNNGDDDDAVEDNGVILQIDVALPDDSTL